MPPLNETQQKRLLLFDFLKEKQKIQVRESMISPTHNQHTVCSSEICIPISNKSSKARLIQFSRLGQFRFSFIERGIKLYFTALNNLN